MARAIIFPFLAFLTGAALTFLVLVVGHSHGYVSGFIDPNKQVELVAVYLGAATLSVAAVGVGVALFGIMGTLLSERRLLLPLQGLVRRRGKGPSRHSLRGSFW
jgi:hypothetical protein